MHIPGLGQVHADPRFSGWLRSEPVSLPVLDGQQVCLVVSGYAEDDHPEEFDAAIANLLACPRDVLRAAEPYIFQYYQDMNSTWWEPGDPEYLVIESPDRVWDHVRVGGQVMVSRRAHGDRAIYVSFECGCTWEPEHGLQIVLRNGDRLVKVGPFDGHLTNSDAYADSRLEHVIYRER